MQLLITLKDLTFVVYVVENKHQVSKNESKIRWLLQNTHERVVRSYDQADHYATYNMIVYQINKSIGMTLI